MQAIILAAGMGRRLGDLTTGNTKCMLKVNGTRLIDRMLNQLLKLNLSRIIIVVGYKGDNLKNHIKSNHNTNIITFIENELFDKTNNIYSLWLAKNILIEDDTLLLEPDLIFEDEILECALKSKYKSCALISKYETWMDGTMVKIDEDNNIVNFIPKKSFRYNEIETYFKTVNVYKFSKDFLKNHYLPFLEAYIKVLGENEYYEQVLRVITLIDNCEMKAVQIAGKHWYEIDDIQDLRIAETLFAEPKERLKKIQNSYGGYWRYTSLLDFCYLVNPYFPTQRMIEEMKANFEPLLREYPSGMAINSLLSAKYFGIKQDYICIGNGAAELIKSLMSMIKGKIGISFPTFEEYPNRLDAEKIEKYHPNNHNFSYTANDLIKYYNHKQIDALLIINPDNPSGNYINRVELLCLAEWTKLRGIRLIIDESFIDFSDEGTAHSLLHNDILMQYPNICIIKSISKSYGVPGLRLGIIATSDNTLISQLKKDVSIWNINSFAEFYLQIYNKYEKDYQKSCVEFRKERDKFANELKQIPYLRVIPSQANYFLCEVLNGINASDLTLLLLSNYNILIKDCSSKKGFPTERQYVRIAIRDRKDNKRLIEALSNITFDNTDISSNNVNTD